MNFKAGVLIKFNPECVEDYNLCGVVPGNYGVIQEVDNVNEELIVEMATNEGQLVKDFHISFEDCEVTKDFKVGRLVKRVMPLNSGAEHLVVEITDVCDGAGLGVVVESNCPNFQPGDDYGLGRMHLWFKGYVVEEEEALPPVEATLHLDSFGKQVLVDRSNWGDVFIAVGDDYKDGCLSNGKGIHLTTEAALQLAYDIKRMALAVQRGEL
jgi:hypothetical protein|nr:MAG TPA: hypothetical protein [Caudoviricetes sp.]